MPAPRPSRPMPRPCRPRWPTSLPRSLLAEGGKPRATSTPRGAAAARPRAATARSGHAFPELSQLAAYDMYDDDAPGAGIITGIGRVAGRECVIVLQRRHRQGRDLLPDDGEEARARAGDRRREQPALHLPVDSGGANLPNRRGAPTATISAASSTTKANLSKGHSADRRGDGPCTAGGALRAGDE